MSPVSYCDAIVWHIAVLLFVIKACCSSLFVLHHVQDECVFGGKSTWNAAEELSLLDAMDMFSFGNWYGTFG